jgi:hypothetical protein
MQPTRPARRHSSRAAAAAPATRRADQIARIYADSHHELRRNVASALRSDPQTIQDACSHAWTQLLSHPDIDVTTSRCSILRWLTTTATRQAWRLQQLRRLPARGDELRRLRILRSRPRTSTPGSQRHPDPRLRPCVKLARTIRRHRDGTSPRSASASPTAASKASTAASASSATAASASAPRHPSSPSSTSAARRSSSIFLDDVPPPQLDRSTGKSAVG